MLRFLAKEEVQDGNCHALEYLELIASAFVLGEKTEQVNIIALCPSKDVPGGNNALRRFSLRPDWLTSVLRSSARVSNKRYAR